MILTLVHDPQGAQELAVAEAVMAETPLMPGIEHIHVETYETYDGNPALMVIFRTEPGFQRDSAWIKEFIKYSSGVTFRLLDTGITRFSYHRLKPAA